MNRLTTVDQMLPNEHISMSHIGFVWKDVIQYGPASVIWPSTGTLHWSKHSCDCSQLFVSINLFQKLFGFFFHYYYSVLFFIIFSIVCCFPPLEKLISPSVFPVYCWGVSYCNVCHNLFFNSPFDRHLSSLQVSAIANNIAMNICVHVRVWTSFYFQFVYFW